MTWWLKLLGLAEAQPRPAPVEPAQPSEIPPDLSGLTLGQKQRKLVQMTARLIDFAHAQGYELTFGDAYRDPRVHGAVGVKLGYSSASSLHKERLAVDFNLFRNGVYLTDTEDHRPLGEFWESLGGTWGGRFSSPDGNHYSIAHGGRK